MERTVILSLSDGEREHLAGMGVTADSRGFLYSASGRRVDAGVALEMLSKGGVSPLDFRRGRLRDGHAAASAAQWTIGAPGQPPMARTGPAGPPGPVGSGTADRTMAAGEDDDLVPGGNEDGEGVGPPDGGDLAKMTPEAFRRHALVGGHAAESPANTGRRGATAVPASDPAEPQDFRRGWLQPGHEDADPANDPVGNNPHPGGTPGAAVYRTAAGRYGDNQARVAGDHLMPSQHIRSEPAACRPVALPADMRASAVPVPVQLQLQLTHPAPGETR
jgi:hypothetical protein